MGETHILLIPTPSKLNASYGLENEQREGAKKIKDVNEYKTSAEQ